MRASRAFLVGSLLAVGFVFGGASAPILAQGHFGITGGLYEPDEDGTDQTEFYGVRGGYRFNPMFGFEASLTRLDLADTFDVEDDPFFPEFDVDLEFELTNLDLSVQWFPGGGNFVVFGGPGIARLESEVSVTFLGQRFSESESSNILTAHAGVGYAWTVGDRFFIRPEARVRSYFDDDDNGDDDFEVSYDSTDYEVGLTFGWRF